MIYPLADDLGYNPRTWNLGLDIPRFVRASLDMEQPPTSTASTSNTTIRPCRTMGPPAVMRLSAGR